MDRIYFDVDHFFADSLSIRLYSPDYVNRELYITISDISAKYIFGSIHLSKTRIDGRYYMEVDTSEINNDMQGKGYGKMLYSRAYTEAIKMGTSGIVSCIRNRSKAADRIWKHYPVVTYAGERYNVRESL